MDCLKGQLLLAAPALQDPNFARSVVLVIKHDADGALGLILNRPTGATVREAIETEAAVSCPPDALLLRGGPCDGPLMVLHGEAELAQEIVLPGVYFSVESDLVQELLGSGSETVRYFHGYAGWAPGQLDAEFDAGGWLSMPATQANVFEPGMDTDTWSQLLKERGRQELKGQMNPDLIPPDPSVN